MVDPSFGGGSVGRSKRRSSHADVRNGQVLLGQIYDALRDEPELEQNADDDPRVRLVGRFHGAVAPLREAGVEVQRLALRGNDGRPFPAFALPCMLFARAASALPIYKSRYPFDPSSIHQLLAWRFGLDPLGVRASDSATFNMAYALDFTDPARTDAPAIAVMDTGTFGSACSNLSDGGRGRERHCATGQELALVPDTAMKCAGGRFAELRTQADALGLLLEVMVAIEKIC